MAIDKVAYQSVLRNDKNADIPVLPVYKNPRGWGVRHTQAVLLFMSVSVAYSMRAQLSVSLVAMTSNSTLRMWYPDIPIDCLYPINNTDIDDTFNEMEVGNESGGCSIEDRFERWTVYRVYKWSESVHEMILFAFFVGYTSMMIPVALLSQKYGGKISIMIALGANGVLSLITPWIPIFGGWISIGVCRLVQGMTQAALYPSVHNLLGKWAPPGERGRLSTYIYTGSQFGTVVAFEIAGVFAGNAALGWPATFWFLGVLSLICCALLAWLGAATPYDHPSITIEEFTYITGGRSADDKPPVCRIPWKQILTSTAVWGIIAAQVGSTIGYLYILTQIPLYMSNIHGVNIKNNGLLSSLPYISMYFTSIVFGNVTDWIAYKKYMRIVNIRRVSNTIGMAVAALFLIGFCYIKNTVLAVTFLTLSLATHSGIHTGFHVNALDLAPNMAGPIMAIGNTAGNLASLTIPLAVSGIVGEDVGNQYKWQILVLFVAAIQILTNAIFVVFTQGTVQPWNSSNENESDIKNRID